MRLYLILIGTLIVLACVSGCAKREQSTIATHPLIVTNEPFLEYINKTAFSPPDPLTPYKYSEGTNWTSWNRFWFTSAISGQAADVVSTQLKLNDGCSEANPLLGNNPSVGIMLLTKAAVIGTLYWCTESYLSDASNQQKARNWIYGTAAIIGWSMAGYNMSVDCY